MNDKSNMELIYEQYLLYEDREIAIDGNTYYKIISKTQLTSLSDDVLITLPEFFFYGRKGKTAKDENGHTFILGDSVHMSFKCEIPDWYMHTITLRVTNINCIEEIGDYLCPTTE